MVLDPVCDHAGIIPRRLRQMGGPFEKLAELTNVSVPETLPLRVYADPVNRLYPCHTKEATIASWIYFHTQRGSTPALDARTIDERFSKMADYWGISHLLRQAEEELEKAAGIRSDEDFALVVQYKSGSYRAYPRGSASEIDESARQLTSQWWELPYPWRRSSARRLLDKAAELDMTLCGDAAEALVVHAGLYPLRGYQVGAPLSKLAHKLRHEATDISQSLVRLSETIFKRSEPLDAEMAEKLATALDQTLYECGWMRHADTRFPAERLIYGWHEKAAQQMIDRSTVQLQTGERYPLSELQKVGLSLFTAVDEGLSQELSTDGITLDPNLARRVIPTLPRDLTQLLKRGLADLGIQPVDEKRAAHGNWMRYGRGLKSWQQFMIDTGAEESDDGNFEFSFHPRGGVFDAIKKHREQTHQKAS